MSFYKVLNKQVYSNDNFSIVPIRYEDRLEIMKWRNEQMYHLRQNEPLTKEKQDEYFNNNIAKLFEEEKPGQILFSYLKGDECIGYGGLVHINWIDKNAEISFVLNTSLEEKQFEFHWSTYLKVLSQVANELSFHKLYVYAFDLRPHLYSMLKKNNFFHDATLKQHCLFQKEFIDVVIYSKIFN